MLQVASSLLPWSSKRLAHHAIGTFRRYKSSKSPSSSRYLARQKDDPFVRSRLNEGYVSRSAFKLKELDDSLKFLRDKQRVIDLGASPGGWTQVICERIKKGGHIIAVDLLPIDEEIISKRSRDFTMNFFQGDFTSADFFKHVLQTARNNIEEADAKVDVVLSDMMINISGNAARDQQGALQLYESVAAFAKQILSKNGWLVIKYFESPDAQQFRKEILEAQFSKVFAKKPSSSRKDSSEMYWVCHQLKS